MDLDDILNTSMVILWALPVIGISSLYAQQAYKSHFNYKPNTPRHSEKIAKHPQNCQPEQTGTSLIITHLNLLADAADEAAHMQYTIDQAKSILRQK